jgi:hypothetical protein
LNGHQRVAVAADGDGVADGVIDTRVEASKNAPVPAHHFAADERAWSRLSHPWAIGA